MPTAVLFTESSANLGGQELQALAQMQGLGARAIQTLLVCRPGSAMAAQAQARGLPCTFAPLRSAGDLPSAWRLHRCIAAVRPAAVICHSGHDAYLAAVATRSTPTPRPRLIRVRTYKSSVSRFMYGRVFDLALTPSAYLREELLARAPVPPDRVEVLYPGIDFDALQQRAACDLGDAALTRWLDAGTGPVLTTAAMLRPEKGHAVLLQSLARLRPAYPRLRCVIAGDGPMRREIDALVRQLGLEDNVFMAGFVDNVAPLLKRSDVVVVPSLAEPLGLTQIEALALRRPVVASRVDGIPETVEHETTGLLARPGDVDAWTAALGRALAAPAGMQAMADQGCAAVRSRFSLQANLDQLLAHCGVVAGSACG